MSHAWWEQPDFYDLHDHTAVAGVEREPEHYREFVIALPPLGADDHLIDVGAGTGKLAALVADAYPELGRVTLVEPNATKLARARVRLVERLSEPRVVALAGSVGDGRVPEIAGASLVIVGSVLMPALLGHTTLAAGRAWLTRALADLRGLLRPGGTLWLLETLAMPWDAERDDGPARRLTLGELSAALAQAGFGEIECRYRFRDRAIVSAMPR